MLGLHSLAGPNIRSFRPPAAWKVVKTARKCFGVGVRVACLPYTGPLACVRTVNRIAVSVAEHGVNYICDFVPVVLAEGVRAELPMQLRRRSLPYAQPCLYAG